MGLAPDLIISLQVNEGKGIAFKCTLCRVNVRSTKDDHKDALSQLLTSVNALSASLIQLTTKVTSMDKSLSLREKDTGESSNPNLGISVPGGPTLLYITPPIGPGRDQ